MSVHITVEKQTASYTTKSVVDSTVEGEDAAYTPVTPPPPPVDPEVGGEG